MQLSRFRAFLIWIAVGLILIAPLWAAAQSPLLAWRQPIYIMAGFAGIVGFCLCCLQPLLAAGLLPGLDVQRGRRMHRGIGVLLVASVLLHVAGLWITSPPDVVDALLFRSPTMFSPFGVIAMWTLFGAALLAGLRRPMRLPYRPWRLGHTGLVVVTVFGTVVHMLLIQGTMETTTKYVLCGFALLTVGWSIARLRGWRPLPRKD